MSLALATPVPTRPQVFERGDHVYLVAPVQVFRPTDEEIASYAYGSSVTKQAPNENIVWFKGQYVEADNPNANGAQWTADELGIKSLTPMLMPVTVMHDPRTAVGTIAEAKLLTPDADQVPRSRIDTVLALWGHRFPQAVHEAETNAQAGTLMQSMECYSPWYACSECGQKFHKLPGGAEEASWCDHLKTSNPSAGYHDRGAAAGQPANASRILGDVTFTGTGLIFGSRGARGAYSEAHLQPFQEEVALHHHTAHTATFTPQRSTRMGLVQIEDTELAALRSERDTAKAEAAKVPDLTTKLHTAEQAAEQAETAKVAAEKERDDAKAEVTRLNEETAQASLKDKRLKDLGPGFTAKLGDFTKGRLEEQARSMNDEEWDARLKEIEETAGVKRDAEADGSSGGGDGGGGDGGGNGNGDAPVFKPEELAQLQSGVTNGGTQVAREDAASVVGSLATVFNPPAKATT